MRTTIYISVKATRFLKKSGFSKSLKLNDIIEAHERACAHVSGWVMPECTNVVYRLSKELKMGQSNIAYYHYVPERHSKRKVIIFLDKMAKISEKEQWEGSLKMHLAAVLVHEFCHVHNYFNRLPIAYQFYWPAHTYNKKMLKQCYEFICEAHAEEEYALFLLKNGINPYPLCIYSTYGHLLSGLNSPFSTYKRLARLMSASHLILGSNWFSKVSLAPPDLDDLNSPEDYAESLVGI